MPRQILNSPLRKPILLVGDIIIDVHHYGANPRMSSEAAVLVGRHYKTVVSWGGAGLVAKNILTLGGRLTFISILGDDEHAAEAEEFFHKNLKKIFFKEKNRKTIVKERFLVNGKKVLRWNRGDSTPISEKTERAIINFVRRRLRKFRLLLISDYRHGLISKKLARILVSEAKKNGVPVYVDSQTVEGRPNHRWYRGANTVCLNEKEAAKIYPSFSIKTLRSYLEQLRRILAAQNVIVKLGEKGSAAMIGNDFFVARPHKVKSVDATGAGDAFFAAIALASENLTKKDLEKANIWAALSVTVNGTEPPSLAMFKAVLKNKQ